MVVSSESRQLQLQQACALQPHWNLAFIWTFLYHCVKPFSEKRRYQDRAYLKGPCSCMASASAAPTPYLCVNEWAPCRNVQPLISNALKPAFFCSKAVPTGNRKPNTVSSVSTEFLCGATVVKRGSCDRCKMTTALRLQRPFGSSWDRLSGLPLTTKTIIAVGFL